MRVYRLARLMVPALVGLSTNCRSPAGWDLSSAGSAGRAGSGGSHSGGAGDNGSKGGRPAASSSGAAGADAGGEGGAGQAGTGVGGRGGAHAVTGGAAGSEEHASGGGGEEAGAGGSNRSSCSTEPVPCERGTECVDGARGPLCEFPTQSAWLVFCSFVALPTLAAVRTDAGSASELEALDTF
ncbi:MAG TPA: hypothetical protein VFV94_05955, partial [Polyangiaceae bacterium]|nr:hypothetical protein [Polyangiaceae bacterium]